jgi:hypothetical protein
VNRLARRVGMRGCCPVEDQLPRPDHDNLSADPKPIAWRRIIRSRCRPTSPCIIDATPRARLAIMRVPARHNTVAPMTCTTTGAGTARKRSFSGVPGAPGQLAQPGGTVGDRSKAERHRSGRYRPVPEPMGAHGVPFVAVNHDESPSRSSSRPAIRIAPDCRPGMPHPDARGLGRAFGQASSPWPGGSLRSRTIVRQRLDPLR